MKTKIIIISVLVVLALSAGASAAWWDMAWERRTMTELTNVPAGGGTYRVNLHYGEGTNTATDIYFNYAAADYFNDTRFVLDNTTECEYYLDWYSYPPVKASVIVPSNGVLSVYYGNSAAAAGTSAALDFHTVTTGEDFESTSGWSTSYWGQGYCGTPSMTLRDNWYTQGLWSIYFTGNCPGAADHWNVYTKPLSISNVHYTVVDYYGHHSGGSWYLYAGSQIAMDGSGARYDVQTYVLGDIQSVLVAVGVCNGNPGGDWVYVDDLRAYCYKKPYTIVNNSFTEEEWWHVRVTDYEPSPIPVLYENDTQTFNVSLVWDVDPSCTTTWYINGTLAHTNASTTSKERSYTNTSLKATINDTTMTNVTMKAVTANSNTSFTWLFPVYPPTVWITHATPTYHPTYCEGQSRTFGVNLTWNGTENVQTKWYIGDTLVYTNPETTTDYREYTNTSLKPGTYTFKVNATPIGNNPVSDDISWTVLVHPTITVPDGYSTIQAAVNAFCAVSTDDTILVRDGTYTENIALPTGCDDISIVSENGSANTIIKAASGSNPTISMSSNNNTLIQGFTIKDGSYGITVDSGSTYTTLTDNILTTNFNAGLYVTGSHPNLIVGNNTCPYNQDGVMLYNAADVTLNDTICTYNSDDGIQLHGSDHITISDCEATYNANNGIEITGSSDFNTVRNNTIEYNNDYGVAISTGSDYNKIYNNEFHNGVNGFDESLNTWYTTLTEGTNIIGGQFIGGNYYSDYEGEDNDHDGIGDTPYLIAGGSNKDMLPLTGLGMWVAFDRPTYLIGETMIMNYHLTEGEAAFGTYNYYVEVRDDQNALRGTWSITYGEENGAYSTELQLGWRTGTYTAYLWRTPKAGGGEVLLDSDTATVGIYMELAGKVYDVQSNITLTGVDVVFNQLGTLFTATSAEDGSYSVSGLEIDKTTAVSATKAGYTHEDYTVMILAEQAYTVDLYMLPEEPYRNGTAIGGCIVSYPFHQAIDGATVDLYNMTWGDSRTTDHLGFYTFENIASGTYSITAAKTGHFAHTPENVTV